MTNFKLISEIERLSNKNYLYRQTDYPKIYYFTNWGHLQLKYNPDCIEEIIPNRNKFIDDYNIKKERRKSEKIYNFIKEEEKKLQLDHNEVYTTNDKKILIITSPYKHVDPLDFEFWGWKRIYPLYSTGAYTFIKEIKI